MIDLEEELAKQDDAIAFELSVIETQKGSFYVILPEDFDDPAQIKKVGVLMCQLIMNWTLNMADVVTIMKDALVEKNKRIIPVRVMPADLVKEK